MFNIFYQLFVLFRRYKFAFFASFFTLLAALLFLASRIKLQEDISGIIPKDKEISQLNKAFEDFKLGNKLVLHLYYNNSEATDPQDLINAAHQLNDSLLRKYSAYIEETKLEFPD